MSNVIFLFTLLLHEESQDVQDGTRALHLAAWKNHIAFVRLLMSTGANVQVFVGVFQIYGRFPSSGCMSISMNAHSAFLSNRKYYLNANDRQQQRMEGPLCTKLLSQAMEILYSCCFPMGPGRKRRTT